MTDLRINLMIEPTGCDYCLYPHTVQHSLKHQVVEDNSSRRDDLCSVRCRITVL